VNGPCPVDLAAGQSRLLAALVLEGPVPTDLDAGHVVATRRQLLDKRARAVAAVWPELAAGFGSDWRPVLGAWATRRPTAGPRLDGYWFAVDVAAGRVAQACVGARAAAVAVLTDWRDDGEAIRRRWGPMWWRRLSLRRRLSRCRRRGGARSSPPVSSSRSCG